jgi:hypothetical protein
MVEFKSIGKCKRGRSSLHAIADIWKQRQSRVIKHMFMVESVHRRNGSRLINAGRMSKDFRVETGIRLHCVFMELPEDGLSLVSQLETLW